MGDLSPQIVPPSELPPSPSSLSSKGGFSDDYDSDLDHQEGCVRSKDKPFICGVVEGFYGRPWNSLERHELFNRMKQFGMNTYLYAPKDDVKHRAYWRDLYTVEEAENLTDLIQTASDNDISFVYSISPGLDITYSSSKDQTILRRKLDQVASFGCKTFALLFDDIEIEMNKADKEVFLSFAHAQASLTNSMYDHLGQPAFMFCPTEYCATRAIPSVITSPYLLTLGDKLRKNIDIMWTGPKVVSKEITTNSIRQLSRIIKRAPLIWDNIHANDYDQKRVFLGPFSGRSPALIPLLAGVLTNPNCEFEANWIALQTLSLWSKSSPCEDSVLSKLCPEISVETEDCEKDCYPSSKSTSYDPRFALSVAINTWFPLFYKRTNPDNIQPLPAKTTMAPTDGTPGGPSVTVPTCMAATLVTQSLSNPAEINNLNQLVNPASRDNINVKEHPISVSDSLPTASSPAEPMEVIVDKPSLSPEHSSSVSMSSCGVVDDDMQVDEDLFTTIPVDDRLTRDELHLMCDLFYLPYEHGPQGVHLLKEFHWLKSNCHVLHGRKLTGHSDTQVESLAAAWKRRAQGFSAEVKKYRIFYDKMLKIPNRNLLWSLNDYLNDMRGTLPLLNTFIKWLGSSKGYKEAFSSGDHEPWVFRGGLTGELQRLLPIDGARDLFSHDQISDSSSANVYTIRPYLSTDEGAVYDVCSKTKPKSMEDASFQEYDELVPDLLIGGMVLLNNQFCFVIEDEQGICGYAIGTPDAKDYHGKIKLAWLPIMQEKYPCPDNIANTAQEAIHHFHNYIPAGSDELWETYPGLIKLEFLSTVKDSAVKQRVLACLLSALKSAGAKGVYYEVEGDVSSCGAHYSTLGFTKPDSHIRINCADNRLVLVRTM